MWKPGQIVTIKHPSRNIVCRVYHKGYLKKKLGYSSLADFAIGMQRKKFPSVAKNCPEDCFINEI